MHVTFSGLLNALDGVAASEERIVFMTTNHFERLDPALIRPGRVDVKQFIGLASRYQKKMLFERFYPDNPQLCKLFLDKVDSFPLSPAQIQGHFVIYKSDPQLAVDNAHELLTLDEKESLQTSL